MSVVISDDQLVALIEAGDSQGLGGLYDRHGSACLAAAVDVLAAPAGAEDLVFEVFLKMWRDPPATGESMRQFLLTGIVTQARRDN